jgi:hypothetical protein
MKRQRENSKKRISILLISSPSVTRMEPAGPVIVRRNDSTDQINSS